MSEEDWETATCWEETTWTATEPGAYQEPTATEPLTLILNEDYGPLRQYTDQLVARKLAETDTDARLRKYKTHMYYHLYQMYQAEQKKTETSEADDNGNGNGKARPASPADQRAEIQRVALTPIKIMEVAH